MKLPPDSYYRKNAKARIDLWHANDWSDEELRDFIDLFEEHMPTSGQRSRARRGLGLEIAFAFVAGGIAAGFLNKVGSDLHESLRKRLKLLLLKRTGNRRPRIEGKLAIRFADKRHGFADFGYHCSYSTDPDLEIFFKSIPRLHEAFLNRWSSGDFPFDAGDAFYLNAQFSGRKSNKWSVRLWRISGRWDKPTLDESFRASVDAKRLLRQKTPRIVWRAEG